MTDEVKNPCEELLSARTFPVAISLRSSHSAIIKTLNAFIYEHIERVGEPCGKIFGGMLSSTSLLCSYFNEHVMA